MADSGRGPSCVEYGCGKPATHRVESAEGEVWHHCDDHAGLDRHNHKVTRLGRSPSPDPTPSGERVPSPDDRPLSCIPPEEMTEEQFTEEWKFWTTYDPKGMT